MKELLLKEQKEREQNIPYVVSGDIKLLLQDWANQTGFRLPNEDFFGSLRYDFNGYMGAIFPGYEFVPEEELQTGITSLVKQELRPSISLDEVYYRDKSCFQLDITRYVDENNQKKGLGRRPGSLSLFRQFSQIKENGIKTATLVDDVLFEGAQAERMIMVLKKMGITIPTVCVGIAIQEGIDRLTAMGITVKAVRTYPTVIDEVCERDFYPGVPFSGRTKNSGRNQGVPYILPFGKPVEWASIPANRAKEFSRFCLKQSIKLWQGIEQASKREITAADFPREVSG